MDDPSSEQKPKPVNKSIESMLKPMSTDIIAKMESAEAPTSQEDAKAPLGRENIKAAVKTENVDVLKMVLDVPGVDINKAPRTRFIGCCL